MSNLFRVLVSAFILTAFYDTRTLAFSEIIRRQMKSLLKESRNSSVEFWLAPATLDDFFEDIGVDVEDSQVWLQGLIDEGFYIPSSYTYNPAQSGNLEQSVEQAELDYAIANHLDAILSHSPRSHKSSHIPALVLELCPTLDALLYRICQARLEQLYQQEWRVEQLNRLINSLMIQLWLASTPQLSNRSPGSPVNKAGEYLLLAIALISLIGQKERNSDNGSGGSGSAPEIRMLSSAEKSGNDVSEASGYLGHGTDQPLNGPIPLWESGNGSKTSEGKSGNAASRHLSSWVDQRLDDRFFLQKPSDDLEPLATTVKLKTLPQERKSGTEITFVPLFPLENFDRDSLNQIVETNLIHHNSLQLVLTGEDIFADSSRNILTGSSKQVLAAGLTFNQFIEQPPPSSQVLGTPDSITQSNSFTNPSYISSSTSISNSTSNLIDTMTNLVTAPSTASTVEQYPVAVSYEPAIATFNSAAFNSSSQVITDTNGNRIIPLLSNAGTFVIENFKGVGRGSNPDLNIVNEVDTLQFNGAGLIVQNLLLNKNRDDLVITFEGQSIEVILKNFTLDTLDNLSPATGASIQVGNILFDGDSSIQDSFDVIDSDRIIHQVLRRSAVTFLNDLSNQVIGFDNSDDIINGQGEDDILDGLGGNDTLRGGTGNDILIGGAGNNRLTGNEGVDTFVISMNGFSQVTDFKPGEDWIGLPNGISEEAVQIEPGTGTYLGSSLIRINQVLAMEIVGVNTNTLLSTANLFQSSPLDQAGWLP